METIGSTRRYALIWCMPNNDDDDDGTVRRLARPAFASVTAYCVVGRIRGKTLQAMDTCW